MKRYIEGSYVTEKDAFKVIQRLREQGYQPEDIFLVANEHVIAQLPASTEAEVREDTAIIEEGEDDRTFWGKVKDAFTVDEYRPGLEGEEQTIADDNPLYAYQEDLNRGNIVIMVTDKEDVVPDGTGYDAFSSPLTDSLDETTTSGTGRSGRAGQRSGVDDLSTAKSSDILPGQDGAAFQTEGLTAKDGEVEQNTEIPEVSHPYEPNPELKKLDPNKTNWDDGSTLDRDGVTGNSATHSNEEIRERNIEDESLRMDIPFDEHDPFNHQRTPGRTSGLAGSRDPNLPDDSEVDDINRRP